MTDYELCVEMMTDYHAFMARGWSEAKFAKPDSTRIIELIEMGSVGFHRGYRDEDGLFWITDEHDLYPSSPVLYRELPA